MGETAHSQQRAAIPATASLRVDPERIERMWTMRPAERIQAAHEGQFTLGEMLQWASRHRSQGRVGRRRVLVHHRAPGRRGCRERLKMDKVEDRCRDDNFLWIRRWTR